jgi:hypothetical protein
MIHQTDVSSRLEIVMFVILWNWPKLLFSYVFVASGIFLYIQLWPQDNTDNHRVLGHVCQWSNYFVTNCFNDWLIDWLCTVLHPAQEFFTDMETSPLPVKGYYIELYALRSGPLCREGSFFAIPTVTWDLSFPISFEGLPHLVASYDTRGDVEDLF